MQRILVDQANITKTQLQEVADAPLANGQARLKIRRFALTANNVTYAATGFVIGYWHFFPTGIDGQGIVPVWGFAEVVETTSDVLEVGERLYGFWPMADTMVMTPQDMGGKTVLDASEHRAKLPVVYNRYTRTAEKGAAEEGCQSLLQPLLATSYLLSDWLQDNKFFDAEQVIVGSASSKTGLGLCKFLSELEGAPVKVIGLTSSGNADYVAAQSGADSVVTYDAIENLPKVSSVYVDMSGNADVKQRLHTHLANELRHSSAVGTSHWDQFRPKQELAGVKPEFFFAPSQIEKRRAEWGPGEIERQITAGWKRLASDASSWLDLKEHNGLEAVAEVYSALATGKANARDGHVVNL
ncbi:uncharacterized protein DUF2855 [Shimia isoporae]|uniref:Uncharacterized protein DUF2855 n=1 Tax=Shimia isoporae TaxID=647720 RepID=A0A4R1NW76_9RHOB|nr:DUF2855 family protein [Shimia isoporae]TCL09382.1 uncharacterized protein DUF2855 [Shimia isoporae]